MIKVEPIQILIFVGSLLIGYLLGSINPGYLFGRLKGIDIREVGTKNAGTANVYKSLGLIYAIPTAFYDTLKGLLVVYLTSLIGADLFTAHLSGLFAILGHIFPFYLKFRGGQGVACATGLLLFYLFNYIILNPGIFYFIFFLLLLVIIFVYVTRRGNLLSPITLPLLGYYVYITYPDNPYNLFFWIILGQITIIGIFNIIDRKMIIIEDESFKRHWWRVATRPFAILFVVFYVIYSKEITLYLIGIVASIFIALDLFRFLHSQVNMILTTKIKALFRKNEYKKFSSMTIFLVAVFITFLLFEPDIAIISITYLIFGDTFGKIFGLAFGRHKIFDKTVEGSLAYLGCTLICSFILYTFLNVSPWIFLIGSISATLIELFSIGVNDNFTVSLICGTIMTVMRIFGF